MKPEPELLFILPCLNEEEGLTRSLAEIRSIPLNVSCEVLVVDGGSTDGSRGVCERYGAKWINSHRGYGLQYRYALLWPGKYVITGDSDGTYPFREAYQIFKRYVFNGQYDFVSCNRLSQIDPLAMGVSRQVANWFLTRLTNACHGLDLADSQSGMWIFRRDAVMGLALGADGMAFSEEIKIEAFKKLKAREVAISYCPRVGKSHINFMDGVKNSAFIIFKRLGLV